MITINKQPRQTLTAEQSEHFLEMLPLIRTQARLAFRRLRPEAKQELVQEVVANAFLAFTRLVHSGREGLAFATPLANYAVRQVIEGRRVGTKANCQDISSVVAQRQWGFTLQNFPLNSSESNIWCELLTDDTLTPVPDQAAFRLDFPVWLKTQDRRKRRLARFLMMGNNATDAAKRFSVSLARISQLRREMRDSWQAFQGETD